MSKYYAVQRGRNPGIYLTWGECKKQVHGYPGARYKSFLNREDAESFVHRDDEKKEEQKKSGVKRKASSGNKPPASNYPETTMVAYVDGSFLNEGYFSCGVVLLYKNEETHLSKLYHDAEYAKMHNVAGEIAGAIEVMKYCLENEIKELVIYHDYEGIRKWCTREWTARKPETRAYRNFYDQASEKCNIRFVKVKGHSGDRYNELADTLARSAHNMLIAERFPL